MYPRKTPQQARRDEEAKKFIIQRRRDQIRTLLTERLPSSSNYRSSAPLIMASARGSCEPETRMSTIDLMNNQSTIPSKSKETEEAAVIQVEDNEDNEPEKALEDSRMSGATNFHSILEDSPPGSPNMKKQNTLIQIMKPIPTVPKVYKNDEEEWAEIYKHNQEVYDAEAKFLVARKKFLQQKFRQELDEHVMMNQEKKQFALDMNKVHHEVVMKLHHKEQEKERKRKEFEKVKIAYEKEERDKQIAERKVIKRQKSLDERNYNRAIVKRIREEAEEDSRVAKTKREEEKEYFRKVLMDNIQRKQLIKEMKEKEKEEENQKIREINRIAEEKLKAREEEEKARDVMIRKNLQIARGFIGKPKDDREKRQEEKVKRWQDAKEKEDREYLEQEKLEKERKKVELREYYAIQVAEKKARDQEIKTYRAGAVKVWQESNQKYAEWVKQKEDSKKEQMQEYARVLRKQINEKMEQKRITNRLFDMRLSMDKKQFSFN